MLKIICLILLFLFPIALSILINFIIDKGKTDKLKADLKYLSSVMWEIIKVLTIVFFVITILSGARVDISDVKIMMLNIVYYSLFFSLIIFVNYFSTSYLKFKICIKTFLDELVKFIKGNFILNLLFFVLLVFIRGNADLTIGLVGAYFFFALTTIHGEYKQNINENNKNFKFIYKSMQVLLNVFILISFVGIEKIILQCSNNQPIVIEFNYILYILILSGTVIVNVYLPQIEFFLERLIKYIKKKKVLS